MPEVDIQMLEDEIETFADQSQLEIEKAWKDVEFIYKKLIEIGHELHLSIDIIGSYATNFTVDVVY